MSSETSFRVTYATMSADNDALHEAYDRGILEARTRLGADHPFYIDGVEHGGSGRHASPSPIDRTIVAGRFAQASAADVAAAVDAARAFAPTWAATPWSERAALLMRAADLISERRNLLAAIMTFEVGKNRLEALGDVEESADLIRYYCHEIEAHDGFDQPMKRLSPKEGTRDVMRPYGVWGVISPFNFPMALAAGPAGAALVAGNTVVLKPSNVGALCALELWRIMIEAGVPSGAFHVVTGDGPVAGAALVPLVDGHHLHRLIPGGHGHLPQFRIGLPQAGHLRDGWQEPGHRLASGRPGGGGRRHHALGVRFRRPEVLSGIPRVHRGAGVRRADRHSR